MHDVRLALRSLVRTRGITAAALLTLGVGIGANAVVFSLVNGLLLRPLPFGEGSERVVSVHSTHPTQSPEGWDDALLSYADFEDIRRETTLLEDVAGYVSRGFTLYDEEASLVRGGSVTPNLFDLLRVEPVMGRSFRRGEGARPGFESVAVISYGLWQNRFGGDPEIVGKAIRINERELEVVGVMPPRFRFPETDDLWVPYDPGEGASRTARFLLVVGRMNEASSLPPVREEMDAIARDLERRYPDTNRGWGFHVLPYRELIVEPPTRRIAGSLLLAVGLVLLVGCANLASLLLARGTDRQRELSVRAALGAGRSALLRPLLAESLLLGIAGGALGTIFALWGNDALVASIPEELPHWFSMELDLRVVAFIACLSLLASLLFGLVPALRVTRFDVVSALGSGRDASAGASHARVQGALVVGQIAASLTLLVGAGLLIQSFLALGAAHAGFDDRPILTFRVSLPGDAYDPISAKVAFYEEAARRIESLPGVSRAAATSAIPADDGGAGERIVTRENPVVDGTETGVQVIAVTPRFFETLDVPLVEGRGFGEADLAEGAAAVAILNRRLAERLWPQDTKVGREIGFVRGSDVEWMRVVGVAPDVQYEEFGEETAQSELNVYLPYSRLGYRGMAFLVRAEGDPAAIAAPVRDELRSFAPGVPAFAFRTMDEVRYFTTWPQRLFSRIFTAFAAAAVLLACLGAYGVVAYRAARRTREIGVRIALGATDREVLRALVGEGVVLAGAGLAAGLLGALALGRILEGSLYQVAAVSPLLYGAGALVLAVSVLLASYIPARRAASIEPVEALRQE
jgi:predicted permease